MAPESQLRLGPMEVQTVDPLRSSDGAAGGPAVVPPGTDGLTLLVESVNETCSDKAAYLALGLPDATYWSKVKGRAKPEPRIRRLTDLPVATQREYVKRWGRHLGMHVSDDDTRRRALTELACAVTNYLREIG